MRLATAFHSRRGHSTLERTTGPASASTVQCSPGCAVLTWLCSGRAREEPIVQASPRELVPVTTPSARTDACRGLPALVYEAMKRALAGRGDWSVAQIDVPDSTTRQQGHINPSAGPHQASARPSVYLQCDDGHPLAASPDAAIHSGRRLCR